jgi:hypothetical protein
MDENSRPPRLPIVRYMGFRATAAGREYTMQVVDGASLREFVLLITHNSFAAREARFQDAPDVCSGLLRRALVADPELVPGACMAVTSQQLLAYQSEHIAGSVKRTPPSKA